MLDYLKTYNHVKKLSLKALTLKLVSFIALSTAARVDTLFKLSIKDLMEDEEFIRFTVDSPLKHNRDGNKLGTVQVKTFSEVNLCAKTILRDYLNRKQHQRSSSKLFVTLNKPHKPV